MGLPFELVENFNTRWYVSREVHIFEERAACVQIAQLPGFGAMPLRQCLGEVLRRFARLHLLQIGRFGLAGQNFDPAPF